MTGEVAVEEEGIMADREEDTKVATKIGGAVTVEAIREATKIEGAVITTDITTGEVANIEAKGAVDTEMIEEAEAGATSEAIGEVEVGVLEVDRDLLMLHLDRMCQFMQITSG